MSNLQAALGLGQLERLDSALERKREIGMIYHRALSNLDALRLPKVSTSYATNLFWVFGLTVRADIFSSARLLSDNLTLAGIGTRPFFFPIHKQPVFLEHGLFKGMHHPVAEQIANLGFYLPSGLALSDKMLCRVVSTLQSLVSESII